MLTPRPKKKIPIEHKQVGWKLDASKIPLKQKRTCAI